MSSLGNSVGEGIDRDFGDNFKLSPKFVNTEGYAQGQGNVRTHAEDQEGTGYDKHGQVKTSFGKWPINFDPVTGTANFGMTDGGLETAGGLSNTTTRDLVDSSASAYGNVTAGQTAGEGQKLPPPESAGDADTDGKGPLEH